MVHVRQAVADEPPDTVSPILGAAGPAAAAIAIAGPMVRRGGTVGYEGIDWCLS